MPRLPRESGITLSPANLRALALAGSFINTGVDHNELSVHGLSQDVAAFQIIHGQPGVSCYWLSGYPGLLVEEDHLAEGPRGSQAIPTHLQQNFYDYEFVIGHASRHMKTLTHIDQLEIGVET